MLGRFDDLLARGLRALVEEEPGLDLCGDGVPHSRLRAELRASNPRVAILDLAELRSPAEVRELAGRHPATHLLLLAERPSGLECTQLLAFGAAACLPKSTQTRDVINAIHLAARGMQLKPRSGLAAADAGALLTVRETEVLARLHERHTNAQIAADLHISIETVRTHARHIYRKLGVGSRRELIAPAAGR